MITSPDQEMKMIGHQCPGVNIKIPIPAQIGYSFNEIFPVTIDVKEQKLSLYFDKTKVDEFNYRLR